MPYDAAAKREARAYVDRVRSETVCARCGKQPVEWHNDEHLLKTNRRIAHLVALGFPVPVIEAEMKASEALCRSCHVAVDGRAEILARSHPRRKGDVIVGEVACSECGTPTKPSWRGKCRRCYDADRRRT